MEREKATLTSSSVSSELLSLLDRGIDEIKAGRTMPHKEAMMEIDRIIALRKEERKAVTIPGR